MGGGAPPDEEASRASSKDTFSSMVPPFGRGEEVLRENDRVQFLRQTQTDDFRKAALQTGSFKHLLFLKAHPVWIVEHYYKHEAFFMRLLCFTRKEKKIWKS